jgi:hypothetical protein
MLATAAGTMVYFVLGVRTGVIHLDSPPRERLAFSLTWGCKPNVGTDTGTAKVRFSRNDSS